VYYESKSLENKAADMSPLTHMNCQIDEVGRQRAVQGGLKDMGSLVSLCKDCGFTANKLSEAISESSHRPWLRLSSPELGSPIALG